MHPPEPLGRRLRLVRILVGMQLSSATPSASKSVRSVAQQFQVRPVGILAELEPQHIQKVCSIMFTLQLSRQVKSGMLRASKSVRSVTQQSQVRPVGFLAEGGAWPPPLADPLQV